MEFDKACVVKAINALCPPRRICHLKNRGVWGGCEEPEITCEDNFDAPSCLGRAYFYTRNRGDQDGWNDKLLIKQFKYSVFHYGLYDDETCEVI